MNCPHCQASVAAVAKFCHSCGESLNQQVGATDTESVQTFVRTVDRDGHTGTRGQHRESGEVRFHYGAACHAHETVRIVERFLDSQDLQTQIIDHGTEIVVQGKRKPNLIRRAMGLDRAVTVIISVEGQDMKTVVGGAKWIDKAAGAAISCFVFVPALLVTGWGVYKQRQLFSRVESEIDAFLASRTGRDA